MSTTPATQKFTIYRGATFHKVFTVLTGDLNSSAQDLSGYSGIFRVYDPANSNTLLTLTASPGLVFGGSNGQITVLIDSTTTNMIPWTAARYSLVITAPSGGDTEPVVHGTLKVETP